MWVKYFATIARRQQRFTPRLIPRLFEIWPFHGRPWKGLPMNLVDEVQEYLAVRRTFGTKLKGLDCSLRQFASFLEEKQAPFVTVQLSLQWATQPNGVSKAYHTARFRWI